MPDDDFHDSVDTSHLLLIVTGAHLRAETADRPLAYMLQERMELWLDEHEDAMNVLLHPVVCSDLWYLNQPAMQRRPTISLGGPGVNALSAYLSNKLPAAFVRENELVVQLDAEFVDLRACVWGMDHPLTSEAVEVFSTKYLEAYLRAVVTQVEPVEE